MKVFSLEHFWYGILVLVESLLKGFCLGRNLCDGILSLDLVLVFLYRYIHIIYIFTPSYVFFSDQVSQHFEDYEIHKAIVAIMSQLRDTNQFFSQHEPWFLVKNPSQKHWLENILHICLTTARISAILLQPIVPGLSSTFLDSMCVNTNERMWKHAVKDGGSESSRSVGKHEVVIERLMDKR